MSKPANKRPRPMEGASGDKRQRLSSDTSEIGETKESDALPENSAGETKEDLAADREMQRRAKIAKSKSLPCIAIIYKKIEGERINSKTRYRYVPIGKSITFTSRVKAGECFGGMSRVTIQSNIDNKSRSKIKGGIHNGKYVRFSNIIVEPIMFGDIEIKPAPRRRSERVKGDEYVYNGIVRIWGAGYWKCTKHGRRLDRCDECGGASLCDCKIPRNQCREHRVQSFLPCRECQQTCATPATLEIHMRTHTGEKPFKCDRCLVKFARNSELTVHEGLVHDIGNEQCTKCPKNCYRPRSWINPETNEVERSCKTCYQDCFGVNFREEQEWSDWLNERFYPEFRTGTNTRISMCTLFFPDGLYEFEGHMILYVDHLILHWEFDENQHSGEKYSGDENRMLKMHGIEKYKDKQWVTVRINPHAYTHPTRNKAKPTKEERKELMLNVMEACLTKRWKSRTNVVYMFYSENNPNIAKNISKTMLYDADDVENFCQNL
jgi:hypothetical protein